MKSKRRAEEHISELEAELDNCRSSLELERVAASSAREDSRRSCKQLQEENAQLKEQLAQVCDWGLAYEPCRVQCLSDCIIHIGAGEAQHGGQGTSGQTAGK